VETEILCWVIVQWVYFGTPVTPQTNSFSDILALGFPSPQ